MHHKTLISPLVWVAVLCCCTRAVSGMMSERQKTEVAITLDRLMHHTGWKSMKDVIISINTSGEVVDPVSTMVEAVESRQKAVDESNVLERHDQIWTALMCKYGELIFNSKCLLNHLIGVCKSEDWTTIWSFLRYNGCIRSLLRKLHSISSRYKNMTDALEYISSLVPQPDSTPKPCVMVATELLVEYSKTIERTTLANLSQRDRRTTDGVDLEITTIGEYLSQVYDEHVQPFIDHHCNVVPENRKWTAPTMVEDFEHAIQTQRIPADTTMLEYVKDEIDHYMNEIWGKWFFLLGFQYDLNGIVKIRSND